MNDNNFTHLDDKTSCIYLKIPAEKVVLMQSHFEIYEGIATVRTLDIKNSLICLIVPDTNIKDCFEILDSIKNDIHFEYLTEDEVKNINCDYLGFKNCKDLKKDL